MVDRLEASHGKNAADLVREAVSFVGHTLAAVLILFAIVLVFYLVHTDPDAVDPKVFATGLAFVIPLVGGFIVAKWRPKSSQDETARYIWVSGLLTFSFVCVWVLDLPTGSGLCEKCGAIEKLTRTFFDIRHGSGLMGGDGLLIGTWMPLSMIGYALGANYGLKG